MLHWIKLLNSNDIGAVVRTVLLRTFHLPTPTHSCSTRVYVGNFTMSKFWPQRRFWCGMTGNRHVPLLLTPCQQLNVFPILQFHRTIIINTRPTTSIQLSYWCASNRECGQKFISVVKFRIEKIVWIFLRFFFFIIIITSTTQHWLPLFPPANKLNNKSCSKCV